MTDLLASAYEFFGLASFFLYSRDMGDFLRGWDETCTDYIGTPYYLIIGIVSLILVALSYSTLYHFIDSPKWNRAFHCWIFAFISIAINFLLAFFIPFNVIQSGNYCKDLNLGTGDCFGFGFSNAFWSFVVYVLLTSFRYPKAWSTNCRYTSLLNP